MSSTDRRITRLTASVLVALGCALGCARSQAPRRVVEREDMAGETRVRLRSELSPARATLGDRVAWRLTATLEGDAKPGALILEAPPASMELDASKGPLQRAAGGGGVWSRELLLRGFDLGPMELPRAALPLLAEGKPDTLEFPRDTLFVDSLTQASADSLRPDKGPIDPPLRTIDVLVAAFVVLLLVVALLLLVRWIRARRLRRDAPAEAPRPPDPPEAVLGRALDDLERSVGSLPRDVFYERLSQALRSYVRDVTSVAALDRTTTELARDLDQDPRVRREGRDALIETLRRADLAKFGRFEDAESDARSILRLARTIAGKLV